MMEGLSGTLSDDQNSSALDSLENNSTALSEFPPPAAAIIAGNDSKGAAAGNASMPAALRRPYRNESRLSNDSITDPITTTSSCTLSPDGGWCRASITRVYFNPTTGACDTFTWGGCGGNANNFASVKDCQQACKNDTASTNQTNLNASADGRMTDRTSEHTALPAEAPVHVTVLPPAEITPLHSDAQQYTCMQPTDWVAAAMAVMVLLGLVLE